MDPVKGIIQIGNASSPEDDDSSFVLVDPSDSDDDTNYVQVDSVPDLNWKGLVANFIMIKAREDVGQKILSHFQNISHGGIILSAFGSVLNPSLISDGKPTNYMGTYGILELESTYSRGRNGKAEQCGGLKVILDSPSKTVQGTVHGSLMAVTPIQVVLGFFTK